MCNEVSYNRETLKDMLAITRIYLEKYELLAEEDKEIFRKAIRFFVTPVAFVEARR